MSIKLLPTIAGLPDRLVIMPDGAHYFVELKAKGGRLRPIQIAVHDRLNVLGHPVVVLTGADEVSAWVSSIS